MIGLLSNADSKDDQEDSEEEGDPSAAIANEEIMRLFDEYSANSRLEPYSDEQEAEGASETPIILSPVGQFLAPKDCTHL